MLSENLNRKQLMIGAKQTYKALVEDKVELIYVADDADKYVLKNIIETAHLKKIEIIYVDSMKKLGKECGIDVGATTVGVLKK